MNETYNRSMERGGSTYGVQGVSGRGIHSVPVSQQAYFIIDMHGRNWELADVEVDVRGFPTVPAYSSTPAKPPPGGSNPAAPPSGGGGSETDDSVFAKSSQGKGASDSGGGCLLFCSLNYFVDGYGSLFLYISAVII